MNAQPKALSDKLILVVDDEELVREVTVMMIEDAGGKALTARDGLEAVEIFTQKKDKITVVFMDFSMPRLNGFLAFEKMQALAPSIPVIIVSGLKMTPETEAARNAGKLDFLNKPFKQDDVIRVVGRALARMNKTAA